MDYQNVDVTAESGDGGIDVHKRPIELLEVDVDDLTGLDKDN